MPGIVIVDRTAARPNTCSQCQAEPSIQCAQCNQWLCTSCCRGDMNQCRLCPYLRAQQGQMHRAEPTDITRGAKAKTPQSLLPTVGKGRKGKDKGKGKYGGGASQPTTYQGVRRELVRLLPQLRREAQQATERQLAAPGHSRAAQVRIRGGETLRVLH